MKLMLMVSASAAAALTLLAVSNAIAADPMASKPVDAAQDKVGAAVGKASAVSMGSHSTGAFVENAARSDMYEIEAGQIAQQKAKSAEVKAFGKMMVTDHTSLSNQMKPLVKKAGLTPPPALDKRRQGFIDNLKSASAADFDKVYIDQQVAAHDEALSLMKGYAEHGDNADLKAAAGKAAPKVEAHLRHARALGTALSGGADGVKH